MKKKTERVAEILKQKNIHVSSGVASATFKVSKNETPDNNAYLRYAAGIVSEYLMDDLSQKLLKYLNLPEDPQQTTNPKRKPHEPQLQSEGKRVKVEDDPKSCNSNVLDLSKPEPKSILSKASTNIRDKARAKAAFGTKNITSFFKKS